MYSKWSKSIKLRVFTVNCCFATSHSPCPLKPSNMYNRFLNDMWNYIFLMFSFCAYVSIRIKQNRKMSCCVYSIMFHQRTFHFFFKKKPQNVRRMSRDNVKNKMQIKTRLLWHVIGVCSMNVVYFLNHNVYDVMTKSRGDHQMTKWTVQCYKVKLGIFYWLISEKNINIFTLIIL